MEDWRSRADSSTTDDNFITSISQLPQIYPFLSPPQNHFSTHTLQIPNISHNPQILQNHVEIEDSVHPPQHPVAMSLEETIASLAAGQSLLVESMARLISRLDNASPRQQAVNDLATGIGNINLDRNAPPHQQYSLRPQTRASYAPIPTTNARLDSPSEGAYARDPVRVESILREPKVRESSKFTGESSYYNSSCWIPMTLLNNI